MLELVISLSAFLCAAFLVVAAYYLLFPQPGPVQQRLEDLGRPGPTHGEIIGGGAPPSARLDNLVEGVLARVGQFRAKPSSQGLRQNLRRAGYYGDRASVVYTGARVLMALLLPVLGVVVLGILQISVMRFIVFIPLLALVGFVLPSLYLSAQISSRKKLLIKGMPDAIDMMMSCVEAGLSLNAALVRVARELQRVHPDLAQEFEITNLEIRAGKTRDEALRNLGLRTGVKDLKSFAAMLIQTDRFGTSIAQALRVFSDDMRTKRRQQAEKRAAETSIKLVFPLVFFIFPFLLIVVLGPGVIRLIETLIPTMSK